MQIVPLGNADETINSGSDFYSASRNSFTASSPSWFAIPQTICPQIVSPFKGVTREDFNFSDAIKHGTVRQNSNTDKILGITNTERETDERGNLKTIDVTYDGKFKPNIAQNFSLNNVKAGHFKQNYGLNGEGGYNSVTAFLDKSIMYADYALKKEGFRPDVLVSAPSSSDFNKYYCTNLSNKLGIPYFNNGICCTSKRYCI